MKFYNIYIEHYQHDNCYINVINEEQLSVLVDAYLTGEKAVTIKGVKRNINNPRKFIIYSITELEQLGKEQVEIEKNLIKSKYLLNNGLMSQKVYSQFGTNVTDSYLKSSNWGSHKKVSFEMSNKSMKEIKIGRIFISHCSKNEDIVNKFCDVVLGNGLNINTVDDVFNTSLAGSKPKNGEDFRDRIKRELLGAKLVLQFISKEYRDSKVCLNEMGAAWVLSDNVIPLIIEKDDYDVGFIHSTNQQCQLTSEESILSLIDDLKDKGLVEKYNLSRLVAKIKEFVVWINQQNTNSSTKIEKSFSDSHIEQGYKSFQTDNPFIKINNHSNAYYYDNQKFREIKDDFTLMFLGYAKYGKANQMNLTSEELKRNLGEPMKSILSAEVWVSSEDNKQWLIYDNYRHHILDIGTVETMKRAKKSELNYKTVKKEELEKLMQGDVFTLKDKIH